ncbi:MAG: hypothetical protein QXX12_07790 [Nanopusillaceae archaeon]
MHLKLFFHKNKNNKNNNFMIFQSELIWIIIVVIITSFVIIYSIYYTSYFSSKTHEISRSIVFDDLALRLIATLYIAKFQPVEKTHLQMMIDSLLYLRRFDEETRKQINLGYKVSYGISLGAYNVLDIIFPTFDNFIGKNRWQLVIYYNQTLYYIYGYNISDNRINNIKSYVLTIPIPDGEVGYIILRVV